MKLRIILLVLSLLVIVSTAMGGLLYSFSLKEAAFKEAQTQALDRARMIKGQLDSLLEENMKPARALAGLQELKDALETPRGSALDEANRILDDFRASLDADVCYLMDAKGSTIATSNRNDPGSFQGQSFAFRPYFRQAMEGRPAVYMAWVRRRSSGASTTATRSGTAPEPLSALSSSNRRSASSSPSSSSPAKASCF
jgi:C4-dicarboxylate-specific signal transduction histidine kinase